MKPIFKWTILQRITSTIWWSIGMFGLIFINMIFYPSFKDQAAELQKSFENLPEATLQFIGGSSDFFSPVGFLNSQIFFLMLPLILSILVISLGTSLIAKEEQDKTIESLLARPISRAGLLATKAASGTAILTFVAFIGFATTAITAKVVDLDVSIMKLFLATFACWLLSLSIGAIAYVIAASGRARGATIGIATTVALGGYIINSLAGTVTWLENLSKLFPFHYYRSEEILRGTYNWTNILFFISVIIVCGYLSYLLFRKRDIG